MAPSAFIVSAGARPFVGRAVPRTRTATTTRSTLWRAARRAPQLRASLVEGTATGVKQASELLASTLSLTLPSMNLSAEDGGMVVQFGAYLAIFVGLLVPVGFLIILYIQSATRDAALKEAAGPEEEEEEITFE